MVLIKRRSCPTSIRPPSALKLPRGDGRISPNNPSPPTVSPESGTAKSFSFDNVRGTSSFDFMPSWLVKAMAGLVILSWLSGSFYASRARATLQDLEYQHQLARINHEEALEMLRDAENSRQAMEKQVQQYQHAQKVLEHEKRVKEEMVEAGAEEPEPVVMDFLQERQAALKRKIESLRSYIQLESKREVLEKYGPGPHRVEFTVEFVKTSHQQETFTVELAPLGYMPHSVHIFLDMVSAKLWDNTIFWHRPGAEHIISSSIANYHTGDTKIHHFEALGLLGVSFAEYSPKYPHKKYTVGFAGRGPIFYINAMDNIKIHGPGGQSHHELPDQADPCFAKVVSGLGVIEKMHSLSIKQSKRAARDDHWRDTELTRIVSARIIDAEGS